MTVRNNKGKYYANSTGRTDEAAGRKCYRTSPRFPSRIICQIGFKK